MSAHTPSPIYEATAIVGKMLFFPFALLAVLALFAFVFRPAPLINPAWIIVPGWAAMLVVGTTSLVSLLIHLPKPELFWRSYYPFNIALCAGGIEFLWWNYERVTASATTLVVVGLVTAAIRASAKWPQQVWLPMTLLVAPLVVAYVPSASSFFSPWLAILFLFGFFGTITRLRKE